MNFITVLNSKEKKEIEKSLKEQFGIDKVDGLILRRGEERLFLFQGEFTAEDIRNLEQKIFIERIGIYFARIIEGKVKLSIEGTQILKDQIKKNIFEIEGETQLENWMKGQDLPIKTGKRDFLVVKHKNDFLGCGKASEEKIGNFIPKSRRLREKSS